MKSEEKNSDSRLKSIDDLDKEKFSFRPKLNSRSTEIAQNLVSFLERANDSSQRQLKLVNLK
jgi:hypothetical protein